MNSLFYKTMKYSFIKPSLQIIRLLKSKMQFYKSFILQICKQSKHRGAISKIKVIPCLQIMLCGLDFTQLSISDIKEELSLNLGQLSPYWKCLVQYCKTAFLLWCWNLSCFYYKSWCYFQETVKWHMNAYKSFCFCVCFAW